MRSNDAPPATSVQQVTQSSSVDAASHKLIDVPGTIWVANEGGNSLTAIDASTGRVVSTVSGIAGPHNVQASEDGRSVWAVSGHDSTLMGVGAESQQLAGTVSTGKHPAHVVVDGAGSRAYVSNSGDDTVTAYDLKSMREIAKVSVGAFPHGMRISPDGSTLMVANMKGGSVTLVDLERMRPTSTIAVGDAPVQVAFDRSGFAYVSLNGEDAVAKIDVKARRVVGKSPTGDGPAQTYVTADGERLLVANQGTEDNPADTLSVFDTASMKLLGTVRTGKGAHGVVADPSGRYAYVTNMYEDTVAVVDLNSLEVVSRVNVGETPNGISYSPRAMAADAAANVAMPAQGASEQPAAGEAEHGHDDGKAH